MPIIEGTYGPLFFAGAPVAGTNEVQTLTIDATGGTFRLGFQGFATGDIPWSATNATLLASLNTALQGSAEVQTITFAATPSGTFRLRFREQLTAPITWSSTNATLVANIDAALEALTPIGTGGVVTAVGTMTNGVGTITVTFAAFGEQLPLSVTDNRTGADISVARTTAGTAGLRSVGSVGIVATAGTLTAGVGTILLTFSGTDLAKKAQPNVTVVNNSLTGAATLTIAETTPGVDASGRGALIGAQGVNTANGTLYRNTGTPSAPTWT
jgi:hypothetical protein